MQKYMMEAKKANGLQMMNKKEKTNIINIYFIKNINNQ